MAIVLPQGAVTGAVIGFVIASVFGIGNASLNSYTEQLNSTVHLCALYNRTVLEDTTSVTRYWTIMHLCKNMVVCDLYKKTCLLVSVNITVTIVVAG